MADPKKLRPVEGDPIVIVLDNSEEGDLVKFDSDDIKDEILDRMGDHAARITKDAGNEQRLKIGSVEVTTRTAAGNPAAITDTNGAESTFLDTLESQESERAIAQFEQSSNSKLLPIEIRKGKTDDQSIPSGLEVLEEFNADGKDSDLAQAVRQVQLDNNRFACEAEYVNPNTREDEDDSNVGNITLQPKVGEHVPRKWPELAGDGSDIQFKVRKLKNLGLQTLLEASGEYFVPDDTDDFASVVAAKAASSAPGLARLGIRIPASRFSAATIAQEVNPDFRKDSNFPELNGPTRFSYGNVNNPLVPFNAVSSTSAGIAAVLLAITVSTLVKALASALGGDPLIDVDFPDPMGSAFGSDGQSSRTQAEIRKKRLGSYIGKDKDPQRESSTLPVPGPLGIFQGDFFILEPTQEPYDKCVARGSEIFFGQVNNGVLGFVGAAFGVGDSFKHVSENPAYYNVLLRMLVRSTTESVGDVVNSVVGIGAAIAGETNPIAGTVLGKSALDIDRDIGLENDPSNLLNIIQSIRESKMVKFMDILAVIGDISLMTENNDNFDPTDIFESSIDGVRDFVDKGSFPNPAALVKKNRMSANVGGRMEDHLAWGSDTLRSMYLLPDSILEAEKKYKGTDNLSVLGGNPNFRSSTRNRLAQEDVRVIEQELDAYYMPFYFHDLRTNEIISFHSFIENITDSHDVEYIESDGYGRIGKVYSYKNTNRSIACSFKVVATSPADFSEMWYKINKLVLMLYPQYTAGRQVSFMGQDGVEKKFIQPFSQLVGSSPMIRMRLGDLIKSNYSDFDLARMFGVGTDQFKIADTTTEEALVSDRNKFNEAVAAITEKHLSADFEVNDEFFLRGEDNVGSRKAKTQGKKGTKNTDIATPVHYRVTEKVSAKKYKVTPVVPVTGVESDTIDFNVPGVQKRIEIAIGPVKKKASTQIGNPTLPATPEEELEAIQDFFNPESNPIMKAFDSVAGQGLAGFIKRLSFDWSDARWDTEGLNNRAPMWMKIDIEFAPVHDINPGIDSSGAPVGMPYNIGSILNLLKMRRSAADSDIDEAKSAYAEAKALAATPSNAKSEDQLSLTDPQAALSAVKLGL